MRKFQSTRPHGARLNLLFDIANNAICFNPRARMGRDKVDYTGVNVTDSFNPRARMGRD